MNAENKNIKMGICKFVANSIDKIATGAYNMQLSCNFVFL